MIYLGSTPIAGMNGTSAEQNAKAYTDEQFATARETLISIDNDTPTGTFKENDVWFITD